MFDLINRNRKKLATILVVLFVLGLSSMFIQYYYDLDLWVFTFGVVSSNFAMLILMILLIIEIAKQNNEIN